MTIKEIAQIAGVSMSTVSKIMNGKDTSIKLETREKVLRIAKEYNYTPYSDIIRGLESKKFLLGVILGDELEDELLLRGINKEAARCGYSVVFCQHDGTLAEEQKTVLRMCRQSLDGVIWRRILPESTAFQRYFTDMGIDCMFCDSIDMEHSESGMFQDYGRLGYEAAAYLIRKRHKKLGCLIEKHHKYAEWFAKGFQKCLYDHHLEYKEELLSEWDESFSIHNFMLYGTTGIVCFNERIADDVRKQAVINSFKVPEDISVVALSNEDYSRYTTSRLTALIIPERELGEALCASLIKRIENHQYVKESFTQPLNFVDGGTTAQVSSQRMKKIVVVGSINTDAVVNVEKLPEVSQTIIAEQFTLLPGGKGSNQAVGVAKLGAMAYLIGVVGQDYEARRIKDAMHQAGVYMEGVSETGAAGTGKAYITVQKNGESSIIIYAGANQMLSKKEIQMNGSIFEDAVYCLLQTETPIRTLEYAAKTAVEKGVKVIVKPAVPNRVSDFLLKQTYIFAPNERELSELVPGDLTLEEKAQYFLDRGVRHIIVTLGSKGCYLRDKNSSLFFSAADFNAVDTTGAADAFLSALAVFMAEGFTMISAIKYATYAAGLSVTRQGAQSSLVDRQTLEIYGDEIMHNIKIWNGE